MDKLIHKAIVTNIHIYDLEHSSANIHVYLVITCLHMNLAMKYKYMTTERNFLNLILFGVVWKQQSVSWNVHQEKSLQHKS